MTVVALSACGGSSSNDTPAPSAQPVPSVPSTPASAPSAPSTPASASYSTSFSLNESPISEQNHWVNNSTDRTRVVTSNGRAYGTQVGGAFDDSYARLAGAWRPNVVIEATAFRGTTSGLQEIELLFRANDSTPGKVTLYEINFAHNGQYVDFVRWEGGLAWSDFTFLVPSGTYANPGGVNTGDRLRGQIIGNTLTAWINKGAGWVLIGSASDTSAPDGGAALKSGAPGIGFYKSGGAGAMDQFGFSDFQVTELP